MHSPYVAAHLLSKCMWYLSDAKPLCNSYIQNDSLENVFEMAQMRGIRRAVDPNKLYTKIGEIIIGEDDGLLEMVQQGFGRG